MPRMEFGCCEIYHQCSSETNHNEMILSIMKCLLQSLHFLNTTFVRSYIAELYNNYTLAICCREGQFVP